MPDPKVIAASQQTIVSLTAADSSLTLNEGVSVITSGTDNGIDATAGAGGSISIFGTVQGANGIYDAASSRPSYDIYIYQGASIAGITGNGIAVATGGNIVNQGQISAKLSGISMGGAGGHAIMNEGRINALTGIYAEGEHQIVMNAGSIAGSYGIVVRGASSAITNSGHIDAATGGVRLYSPATAINTVTNTGTIASQGNAVWGDLGSDRLTNHGTIVGSVLLYDGNDVLDNRGGTIVGLIHLGIGNDTAYGGAGDETFTPAEGNDWIDGGGGNDTVVYGGRSADYTVTTAGSVTTVADKGAYQDGSDTLAHVRFLQFADRTVTLTNAAPDAVALSAGTVAEDAAVGKAVASLSVHDADEDAVTYSLVSDGDGFFTLQGSDLVLAKALDYESQAHGHTVAIKASDPYGGETLATFTLAIADVADTPPSPAPAVLDVSLRGTARADKLIGQEGNDMLKGLAGNDTLKGLNGNDQLWGGAGKDVLTGSAGKDIFVFDAKPNTKTNLDKITDFSVKDDTLWLDNHYFTKLGKGSAVKPGKLNAKFFTLGDHAKDKDDYLIYDNKKGVLWYDADGSGSHKAVEIATLKKGLKMTYHDVFVI